MLCDCPASPDAPRVTPSATAGEAEVDTWSNRIGSLAPVVADAPRHTSPDADRKLPTEGSPTVVCDTVDHQAYCEDLRSCNTGQRTVQTTKKVPEVMYLMYHLSELNASALTYNGSARRATRPNAKWALHHKHQKLQHKRRAGCSQHGTLRPG